MEDVTQLCNPFSNKDLKEDLLDEIVISKVLEAEKKRKADIGAENHDVKHVGDHARSFHAITIAQGIYAVETFFFVSGFLLAYSYLKEHSRTGGRISWVKFYVHRYIRLTPAYFMLLWVLFIAYSKYIGNGPFWTPVTDHSASCQKYWWINMLYVNNFVPDDMAGCMGHTFYLANDMQLYIISPILLIPFTRSIRLAIFIAVAIIAGSCTLSGILNVTNNFPITTDLRDAPPGTEAYNTMFDTVYNKPYIRIVPHTVGMLTGFLIYKNSSITMSKVVVALGWLVSLTTMLTIIYSAMYMDTMSIFGKILHYTFGKLAWSMCITWIIVSCFNGYGGLINTILSLRIWNPMSRLTYCTYLWHNASIFIRLGKLETSLHYDTMQLNIITIANIILAFAGAIIVCLFFEAPFISLEGVLLSPKKNLKQCRAA